MPPKPVPSPAPKPATPAANLTPTTVKAPDFSKLGDTVTFIIGSQKKKFLIHKSFACHASPVLKAAFNGAFIEGETQTYTLEDTTEDEFTLLSQFIYTQRLEGDLGGMEKAVPSLCRLWILAEKLLMPRLQNLVIDRIDWLRPQESVIHTTMFQYVWDNTMNDSPLRRLFISQCAWNLAAGVFVARIDNFPKEMLAEICSQLKEHFSGQIIPSRNMADYYVKEG